MSLSKKALMIGIGSTLAVGGVTTAIAVPLSQRQSETKKPESKPWTSLTAAKNVEEALNKLTISSIVFKNKNGEEKFKRNQNYAFNIEASELSLKEEEKQTFPSWITFEFKINQSENKVVDLNKGRLSVELEAKNKDEVVGKKTFNITGFKAVSEQANKLVKEENGIVSLDLSEVETSSYRTIEALNEVKNTPAATGLAEGAEPAAETVQKQESGISALLHKLMIDDNTDVSKNWDVQGSVKLEKISVPESKEKAYFYLTNKDANQHLKLVTNAIEAKEEVLVDQIVVTNLLASNISIRPNGINEEENKAFIKGFVKADDSGYEVVKDTNNVQLKVKKTGDSSLVSTISVNPYLVEKAQNKQEVKANLLVSFGNGETAKTYDLANDEQLKELNAAGFGFGVYLKKIDGSTDQFIKAMNVSMNSALDEYFTTSHFSMPFATTMLEMMASGGSSMVPKGGFTKQDLTAGSVSKDFMLGTAEKTKTDDEEELDTPQAQLENENWVSFATYTYKGISDSNVLLTPSISIIHLGVKTPVVDEEIRPTGSQK